jgi:hypothetical protein
LNRLGFDIRLDILDRDCVALVVEGLMRIGFAGRVLVRKVALPRTLTLGRERTKAGVVGLARSGRRTVIAPRLERIVRAHRSNE